MHDTAMEFGAAFFNTYAKSETGLTVVEIGSQDVNGSLRAVCPPGNRYIGVDFAAARGVDVVLDDPYVLPFEDGSIDIVMSSSCFEHSEFFWLLFNETLRILKPNGLLYLNVPSNGAFHRYPVDCWRFYPDSGMALERWGRKSGYPVTMLESFTGRRKADIWNDFITVYVRDENHLAAHPNRMCDTLPGLMNVRRHGTEEITNFTAPSQDQDAHAKLIAIVQSTNRILTSGQ